MAIVDYKKRWKQKLENINTDDKISKKNKKALDKFLISYDVSEARKDIFLDNIKFLLQSSKDIIKDMHDANKINRIFAKHRDNMGVARYETLKNVSNKFVRDLNNGTKPKGFEKISSSNNNKQKRNLKPIDMITWDDGLKLAKQTNSIQIKAIILTQLNGGLRPSEFYNLNYGDVERKEDIMIINVTGGKTGARPVIIYRAVPFLSRWLTEHPTKRKNDPLWIREFNTKSRGKTPKGLQRYAYSAMAKRVKEIGIKIKLDKPLDFYNLRHSACVLAKLDNLPIEEASKNFGHSVEFFTKTYGRLSTEDSINRIKKSYGLKEQSKKIQLNITCSRCDFINSPESYYCQKCSTPLNIKVAKEGKTKEQYELEKLKKEMEDFKTTIYKQIADTIREKKH